MEEVSKELPWKRHIPRGLFDEEQYAGEARKMDEEYGDALVLAIQGWNAPLWQRPFFYIAAWLASRRAFAKARLLAGARHSYGRDHIHTLDSIQRNAIKELYFLHGKPGERHLLR